jgi:excisionase family DNA binding protein
MSEMLTVKEVAERLKLQERTIRDWIKIGKIKAVRLGKAYRIDADELVEVFEPVTPSTQEVK